MWGRVFNGGRTDRSSSRVIDDEKGFSHFQSLNHFASPLVLFFWTGGSCTVRKGLWILSAGKCGSFGWGICLAALLALLERPETERAESAEVEVKIKTRIITTPTAEIANGAFFEGAM